MAQNGSFNNTPGGQIIQEKLNDQNIAAAIGRLMTKMDRIEATLDKLDHAASQAPSMLSIAADSIDEEITRKRQHGIDIDSHLRKSLDLILHLTQPETIEKLEMLLKLTQQLPGLISMGADIFDEEVQKVQQQDLNLDERMKNGFKLLSKMTESDTIEKLDLLLKLSDQIPGFTAMAVDAIDEGIPRNKLIGEKSLQLMKDSLGALNIASNQPPAKVGGIFGAIRSLKDPDRQKSIGVLLNFLKELGKTI